MYTQKFDVRWSDLDANRHMANSAYQNFMSHTRMAYLIENGFGQREMQEFQTGPVIFNENVYYFKEILQGNPVTVTCELTGLSADGSLFSFRHDFFDANGKNLARGLMMGAWMNLKERKITSLHEDLLKKIDSFPKSKDFKEIHFKETRSHGQVPEDFEES